MSGVIDFLRQTCDAAARVYQSEVSPRLDALGDAAEGAIREAIDSGLSALVRDPIGFAADALRAPAQAVIAGGTAVIDVATAVHQAGGVGTVLGDIVAHNAGEVARIQNELQQRPAGFVDWILGPDGPQFQDQTAQVPGLQDAFGDLVDAAMGNRWIAGPIGQAFGFEYVPGQDFYTTNESSMQSYAGFHDIYDKAGKFLGMDLDDSVMEFQANGIDYRLELWRGSYAGGGAFGGEIALYTRGADDRGALGNQLEGDIPSYYSAASGDNQIEMSQTIYNQETGDVYFTNHAEGADGDDGRHFWNLGIRTDPAVNHELLGQRGELGLPDDMPAIERQNLAEAMMTALQGQEGIQDVQISDDGMTISYDWS